MEFEQIQFSNSGFELCGFASLRETTVIGCLAPAFPQRRKDAKKAEIENDPHRNAEFLDLFRVLSCDFVVKNSEEMKPRNHTKSHERFTNSFEQ